MNQDLMKLIDRWIQSSLKAKRQRYLKAIESTYKPIICLCEYQESGAVEIYFSDAKRCLSWDNSAKIHTQELSAATINADQYYLGTADIAYIIAALKYIDFNSDIY